MAFLGIMWYTNRSGRLVRCSDVYVERRLHNDANMPLVSSYLLCHKGHPIVVEDFDNFVDAFIVRISFD